MSVVSGSLALETRGDCDIIDITRYVASWLNENDASEGTVTVFVSGSTGGVTTLEYESGLISDLKEYLDSAIPRSRNYKHNLRWGDGNGHSHVRAAMMGPSLTIPVREGEMTLGTWQQVVFCDFDNRPRKRNLLLTFTGTLG